MRRLIMGMLGVGLVAGCSSKQSSLLLERRARGVLADASVVARRVVTKLDPVTQAQTKDDVEVMVTFASPEYLKTFFSNRAVFGPYAGQSPFAPQNLVFYVRIANRSEKRIRVSPWDFVLVDDVGNQYSPLDVDYVVALGEARTPMATMTRGILEEARPGYFGLSLPVGKMVASKPQGPFALIKQSMLQQGYLYPGVVHDGLVAFWSPSLHATKLTLLVTNIKTNFDASDLPKTSIEHIFTFQIPNQ